MGDTLRLRLARIRWWFARRPATTRALRRFRLVTVLRTALAPQFARLRTRLTEPSGFAAIGLRGLMRALRGVGRVEHSTPAAFPQDTDGRIRSLGPVPEHGVGGRRLRRLRRAGGVRLDHPAPSAETVIALARAGVVLQAGEDLALPGVEPELAATIRDIVDPADHDARELQSVRLRRLGWGSGRATPSVSVLLASRRPDDLLHAVSMVEAQRGCDVQLCVGLHGDAWSPTIDAEISAIFSGPVVIERFADDVDLGSMLRSLAERADGRYLSKWDDDDLYGSSHLFDLVLAHDYSGADLVGKGAEFVYLEESDRTIRRFAIGAERPAVTLAGGSLLLERERLAGLGGWPTAVKGADQRLIDAVLADGGVSYRTHGFQFILRRRPTQQAGGHTWAANDGYFLADAVDSRPGLDLAYADIVPPAV